MDNSTFFALFCGLTILYAAAWIAIEQLIPPPALRYVAQPDRGRNRRLNRLRPRDVRRYSFCPAWEPIREALAKLDPKPNPSPYRHGHRATELGPAKEEQAAAVSPGKSSGCVMIPSTRPSGHTILAAGLGEPPSPALDSGEVRSSHSLSP